MFVPHQGDAYAFSLSGSHSHHATPPAEHPALPLQGTVLSSIEKHNIVRTMNSLKHCSEQQKQALHRLTEEIENISIMKIIKKLLLPNVA